MRPIKTDKARAALARAHTTALDIHQRRVLILCDGRRTEAEIVRMLGEDARQRLAVLLQHGYLVADARTAPSPAPVAGQAAPAAVPQSSPSPSVAGPRRSLAASKMYVLDLLQLQRDYRLVACRSEIQCARDEAATAVAILDSVRQLLEIATPSYGQRVLDRLDEILPESYLPPLRALAAAPGHDDRTSTADAA